MIKTVHGLTIECVKGDITNQPGMQAVVNAANAELSPGGGVAGAIHKAAGEALAKACEPWAPIEPTEAVVTEAFDLPNDYVIHCLGPVYGVNRPEDLLLRKCYDNILSAAEEKGIETVAVPALSTGVFRYPLEEASDVAIKAVSDKACSLSHVKHVRFVLYDEKALNIHEAAMKRILE
ncbi:MAG: macro domain-containing protein [Candidatus Izemoplasmataceae bacterium]